MCELSLWEDAVGIWTLRAPNHAFALWSLLPKHSLSLLSVRLPFSEEMTAQHSTVWSQGKDRLPSLLQFSIPKDGTLINTA